MRSQLQVSLGSIELADAWHRELRIEKWETRAKNGELSCSQLPTMRKANKKCLWLWNWLHKQNTDEVNRAQPDDQCCPDTCDSRSHWRQVQWTSHRL